MAHSPSPQQSPTMAHSHLIDRQMSNSPPPAHSHQLSKRDKRRSLLANRLDEITQSFATNRDANYRNQLQALQCDMNIIMEADPYGASPLPDSREEIDSLVSRNLQKAMMKTISPAPPLRAGMLYAQFAKDVNDAIEERDTNMTRHYLEFESKKTSILTSQVYRRRLAENEHKALASTVRDRLINSISKKRERLHKDKDILEIGEGNALLLHPSQFSISNPGSPGGLHGKRATRNRREPEELLNSTEIQRRKRKAQDSDDAPPSKGLPTTTEWAADKWSNGARPGQHAKEFMMGVQFDSALYSVEKLFSDKELAMSYHAAAMAAHAYIVRQPNSGDELDSPANGTSETNSDPKVVTAEAEADDAPSPPPSMERQPSHATRSTRAPFSSNLLPIDLVTGKHGLYTPPDIQLIARSFPKMPPLTNLMGQRTFGRNDPVVSLTGLGELEAQADLECIKRSRIFNDENGYGANLENDSGARELLTRAAFPNSPHEHWMKASEHKPAASSIRDDPMENGLGLGGVDMGRDNSSMGGTAMSRQATDQSMRDRIKRPNGRKL